MRHLSLTPPLQLSTDKYRGQGTGKIISLCRQEKEKRETKRRTGMKSDAEMAFFFLFCVIAGPVLCQAFFFFLHSQRTQTSFCFPYLWYLAVFALILALVIITTTTEFWRALGRSFLGRPVWLKNERQMQRKTVIPTWFFLFCFRVAFEMFSKTIMLLTDSNLKTRGKCRENVQLHGTPARNPFLCFQR